MTKRLCRHGSWALVLVFGCVAAHASEPPKRSALFGDVHIHTMYSVDAFMGSVRTTPDHAYRYAKGEPIPLPSGESVRLSGAPLDFLAVSDHAMYLGAQAALLDPSSPSYGDPATSEVIPSGRANKGRGRFVKLLEQLVAQNSDVVSDAVTAHVWEKIVAAAEQHDDPGNFTALIGYEYTPSVGGRHLHRNVIFRSANVPALPFSSLNSADPENLWKWMDALRDRGIEVLAIPHNMNQSDGLAFQETTFKGAPIDRAFAEMRMRNEPIAEISQYKGTSETHPSLSPNDEWANFQIVQYYLNRAENKDPISVFEGGYYRDALRTGLEMQVRDGFNPYQLGAIGSSDSHTTAASYEEDRHFTGGANTARKRGSAPDTEDGSWEGYWTGRQATHGTGGLAGVWAEENTRASIFDAMRRRETFATSGPRIRVRFFGGVGLDGALEGAADEIAAAYSHGVPMGGVLSRKGNEAPSFLVWAMRDPGAGWLQRAQIIKGWVEDGESREAIFDVACCNGLEPDPRTHRCGDNGARVNLTDCSVSRDKGATQLRATWTDPQFDPSQAAFYYVRVLENPSCRWSTWDAIRLGIEPNPDLEATVQKRAWSSPIWYSPGG
jgi:hypothetical protein